MELRTEIEIAAAPGAVWAILADFPGYASWNPFIVHIVGELRVGAKLAVTLSPPGGSDTTFHPKVLVADPERELRFRGALVRGLFDDEHFLQLAEVSPGRTRVVHGANLTGLMVRAMGGSITNLARGCVYMNQALQRQVEQGPGRRRPR